MMSTADQVLVVFFSGFLGLMFAFKEEYLNSIGILLLQY